MAGSSSALAHLTESEQALYQDLVTDLYGVGVRMEQERVLYSGLCAALR
ncbi:MAG: Wadjet anti-phage system protein JetD domain-containing protein [Acidimicrobiales bacterium]